MRYSNRLALAAAMTLTATALVLLPALPAAADDTDQVLVGAGDIAKCDQTGDDETANLLDNIGGLVFTAGDGSQDRGSAEQYNKCYNPSWGRHIGRTLPAPGNHDYVTKNAAGYFGYFGRQAGDPTKGYYSYDLLDNWLIVSLNSNCDKIGGCGAGSPQEQWLRGVLAANAKPCIAAVWHHPLFSSASTNRPDGAVKPLYQALYEYSADVVLNGHNHLYERFGQQDPDGNANTAQGAREFIIGTGGTDHHAFQAFERNSEAHDNETFGVLKLTLKSNSYQWEFVPVSGGAFTDSGSTSCH